MPALRLTAGKPTGTRKSPARTKPAAAASTRTPKRKPAAATKPAAKRTPKPNAKANGKAKVTPAAPVERGPRMPEGWKQRDWDKMVKEFEAAKENKLAAQEALAEAQTIVNELAMDYLSAGVQMSVVSETLSLSRQRLYDLMDLYGVQTERQAANPHPNKGLTQEQIEARKAKEDRKATKAKPAAKRTPKRAASKPAASRTPARKPTAKRTPARKPAARGGVRLARTR